MALDTVLATIGGALKNLIVGKDAQGNVAPAHVIVGADGTERGIQASPLYVAQTSGPWAVSFAGQQIGLAAGSTVSLAAGAAAIGAVSVTGSVAVTGAFFPATQPVSVASLPLPSGAAQDGTDATGVTAPAGGAGIRGWLSGIYSRLGSPLAVTGAFFQATQPVSGTVTANAGSGTMAVSAAALPLPTGAAQDGADATGVTAPTGAAGIRGWLSSIFAGIGAPTDTSWSGTGSGTLIAIGKSLYGKLAGVLSVTLNGSLPAGTNLLGSVNVNGTQTVQDVSYATHAPGYYQASVTSAAQALATLIGTSIPSWATMAFITPENGPVRYRADGTAPTTAIGQPIAVGQAWPIQGASALAAAQFIANLSTTVSVEFRG